MFENSDRRESVEDETTEGKMGGGKGVPGRSGDKIPIEEGQSEGSENGSRLEQVCKVDLHVRMVGQAGIIG